MILYHFTSWHALKNAGPNPDTPQSKWQWTDDINPGPDSMRDWNEMLGFDPSPAVWFTSDPKPPVLFAGGRSRSDIRLTVDLSPDSKRLWRWEDYLSKCLGPEGTDRIRESCMRIGPGLEFFYAYFGSVPSQHVRALERAPSLDPT